MSEKDKKYIDGLLEASLERASAQELEELFDLYCDENNEDEVTTSGELDEKIFKLIEQERKKERTKKRRRVLLRAVASVAIVITIAAVSIASVEAWKLEFLNFVLIKDGSDITFYHQSDSADKNGKTIVIPNDVPTPSYLPDGFEIDSGTFDDVQTFLIYRNGKRKITIQIMGDESVQLNEFAMDNQELIKVAGIDAYYMEKEEENAVVFGFGSSVIRVSGDMEKDELVKIAQSMS